MVFSYLKNETVQFYALLKATSEMFRCSFCFQLPPAKSR